ncbi:hypothetical protein AZE42_06709 [Rhizopogon vesiculosus]|uniref:Cytochrome P450 n=1 Tax=Rhizopogon vesiculosus TaxID=180088 RepID=A0A1J8QAK2_9AGAM|nr:hypothetical protein AZE42_06709 [Rhizopogon vesiculosus]
MFFAHILAVSIPCAIAVVAALRWTRGRVYPLPLPPGPRPLPFLGNALQLDTTRPWLTYTAWRKIYGNIIYSRLFGIDMIILNSDTIARELFNKRSAIYSDRPVIHTRERAGLAFNTGLLPYGETLQQHRKIYHQVLKAETSASYSGMYTHQANELVVDLLSARADMQKPKEACERYMGGLTMVITYGHIPQRGDPVLARAHELVDIVARIVTPEKAALFSAFPFLKRLPAWFFSKDYALMERSRELCQQLLNEPFNEVKAQMAKGTVSQSLVSDFLSQTRDDGDEETLKAIALSGYLAGTGTVS